MGATGSRRGIAPLVEEHYQSLYRYAYRLSGAAADAEDLTQEAFCKAQAQLATLRDPDRAKPWLIDEGGNPPPAAGRAHAPALKAHDPERAGLFPGRPRKPRTVVNLR